MLLESFGLKLEYRTINNAPLGVFFPDKSCFVNPQAGGGVQILARIPINNPKDEN